MESIQVVLDLKDRFERNIKSYRDPHYKEAQLRVEFLDPFFGALGWDINNKQGFAEAYKHVIHEDSLKEGTPDYCFRIGGVRKFFVEAKKPSINIKEDSSAAYQLRRYGWSAKLPVSILTDFEEMAIYDCRIKPLQTDKASAARIQFFNLQDYESRWDELVSVFSPDAILKGSFDKFAFEETGRRGSTQVDVDFLDQIEKWRFLLAKSIAHRNQNKINQEELNFTVQKTLDRIIFLRICEDRGIEEYGQLKSLLEQKNIYKGLFEIFKNADKKFNSGLFHFQKEKGRSQTPDTLTPKLEIDDATLTGIIKNLYAPSSSYEFSVFPPEILGQVYEQFLGKVICLTSQKKAIVKAKPEVKKADGVYYTPVAVVAYIVKTALEHILIGKSPKQMEQVKILDPACGSGSFLLITYQYLLDWHLAWYMKNSPENWAGDRIPAVFKDSSGNWRLSSTEKKRILLNNIFGVDQDSQAVEVTKLSLLLKVIEGESKETLALQLKLFKDRALPDLGNNIKCGNSLIDPDFMQTMNFGLLTDAEAEKINPFDWNTEFPKVINTGGFNLIIGNPPWGAEFSPSIAGYLKDSYSASQDNMVDSYMLFIEKSMKCLGTGGILGFVTPDTFLRKDDFTAARKFLFSQYRIREILETGPIFPKVRDTWCAILFIEKTKPTPHSKIGHKKLSRFTVSVEERLHDLSKNHWYMPTSIFQKTWANRAKSIVGYFSSQTEQDIIKKIETHPSLLSQYMRISISRGEEGSKQALRDGGKGDFGMLIPEHVEAFRVGKGLKIEKSILAQKKVSQLYLHPKIWIIRIQKMRWKQRIVCGLDCRKNSAGMKTLQIIVSTSDDENDLKFLTTILNSKLVNFWATNFLSDDINGSFLEKIPVPSIPQSGTRQSILYSRLVDYHDQIAKLKQALSIARTASHQAIAEKKARAFENMIDTLVYRIYGLSEEEIRTVELALDA